MIPVTLQGPSQNETANGLTLVSPVEAAVERVESTVKHIKRNNARRRVSVSKRKGKSTGRRKRSTKTSTKKRTKILQAATKTSKDVQQNEAGRKRSKIFLAKRQNGKV